MIPTHRTILFGACLLIASIANAQVPQLISYQGRVTVNGAAFTGNGLFKFGLVTVAGENLWTNDGTALGINDEPTAAVTLDVTNGLYAVLLGNATLPNMTVIQPSVFANDPVFLRIWFDDGQNGSLRMQPDQQIAAVGYAMMASTVQDASITAAKLVNNSITTQKLTDNVITTAKISDDAVTN